LNDDASLLEGVDALGLAAVREVAPDHWLPVFETKWSPSKHQFVAEFLEAKLQHVEAKGFVRRVVHHATTDDGCGVLPSARAHLAPCPEEEDEEQQPAAEEVFEGEVRSVQGSTTLWDGFL
jgi:hypothetical protein